MQIFNTRTQTEHLKKKKRTGIKWANKMVQNTTQNIDKMENKRKAKEKKTIEKAFGYGLFKVVIARGYS